MSYHCSRCDRWFNSRAARSQHRRDSNRHWSCSDGYCDYDAPTWDDLAEHCEDEDHGAVCWGCEYIFEDHAEFLDHLEEANVCKVCNRHFDTQNSLIMHELTHRRANIECYLCDRLFTTYGGLIIHLEAGNCSNAVDLIELNRCAAGCWGWSAFLDRDLRIELLRRQDSYLASPREYPFRCPTCDTKFTKLSGLFQHIESPACSQTLHEGAIGTLRKRLKDVCIKLHNGDL